MRKNVLYIMYSKFEKKWEQQPVELPRMITAIT